MKMKLKVNKTLVIAICLLFLPIFSLKIVKNDLTLRFMIINKYTTL